jgi:hypothetical protein
MPKFDVSIFLASGATVKLNWDLPSSPAGSLKQALENDGVFTLESGREDAVLVIKNPKEKVVGYLVDREP